MKTTSHAMSLVTIFAFAILSGCASPPSKVEQAFGNSTRLMISEQTFDPEAVDKPITALTLDGPLGDKVLDHHRTDIAKPETVSNEIIFNIGGN